MPVRLVPGDPHDASLLGQVRPPAWINPTPQARYDLVVLGAGTAGLVTAAGAAALGARVALVERELMGGDCLNVGCVPSKALLRAARVAAQVRDSLPYGVAVDGWRVDFPKVMERMRRLRAELSLHDCATRFRDLGVDVFLGPGRFVDSRTVMVEDRRLAFRKAVIATGACAHLPAIPGLDQAGALTNESVFALTSLPRRLAVLGAGPVGCELAQAFARFGSEVTLFGSHAELLPREDPDVSERLLAAFRHDGITCRLGTTITRVTVDRDERVLEWSRGNDGESCRVDAVLVGAGRVPNVENLGLETAGVRFDSRTGIDVNDHLRTSNPCVFAAGDVCSAQRFTHAADAMARIVIRNALFWGRSRVSDLIIPHCTYTDPEIAHIGLREADARQRGIPHRVYRQEFTGVDRARLDGEDRGFVKLLAASRGDRILGATIVASHAGEMIGEVALAMTAGLGLNAVAATIHPYPTQAEALKKVADAHQRSRLTPVVAWLLRRWLAWGR